MDVVRSAKPITVTGAVEQLPVPSGELTVRFRVPEVPVPS